MRQPDLNAFHQRRGAVAIQSPNEMRTKIVEKASEDADFRAKLLSDPRAAVEQELG